MSGLEKAAAAKTLSTDFNKLGLRKITALFETTKANSSCLLQAKVPSDVSSMTIEFMCGGGNGSIGAHATGGSSGGGCASHWVENAEIIVIPNETLYIKVGKGGIGGAVGGAYTAAQNGEASHIRRYGHNGIPLSIMSASNTSAPTAATATRGASNQAFYVGDAQFYPNQLPADASDGVVGQTLCSIPQRTVNYSSLIFPPKIEGAINPFGYWPNMGGSGAGVAAGVGKRGGDMSTYDMQLRPYAGAYGYGAQAGGGSAAWGLDPAKYQAWTNLDVFNQYANSFKFPNTGQYGINVDTPNQDMWGTSGVGAATGHMGGNGGDGVICISFYTAQTNIDSIWTNPYTLIDTGTYPTGLPVPSNFIGMHGWNTADEITNGKMAYGSRLATLGTVTVTNGVATYTTKNGYGLYWSRKGQKVFFKGMGVAGADFYTTLVSSSYFGDSVHTHVPVTLADIPPNISGAVDTHEMRIVAYVPPYNWKILRTHDGAVDWCRVDLALANGTLTNGSNVISGVTLLNRNFVHISSYMTMANGLAVVGAGIPAGATVTAFDSVAGTITISANATVSGAVSAKIYNKPLMDSLIASPMMTGKKIMFAMGGCPEWLAKSIVQPTTRTVSGNSVTINHAALPYPLQVGTPLRVRNSAKSAINGWNNYPDPNWTITASTTISTTFNTPTATGNETAVADTEVEIICGGNEGAFGYAHQPNAAYGAGLGEVNNFITWLMTNYGSYISHIDGWNEANTAYKHNNSNALATDIAKSAFYLGTRNVLGEIVKRTNQAAKAIVPTVLIGSPSITGIVYGQPFYISDDPYVESYGRSSAHYLLSATDGSTGKILDWCDYLSLHVYGLSGGSLNVGDTLNHVATYLKFIPKLLKMESINKPNIPIIMSEGGYDSGSLQTKMNNLPDSVRYNEIRKWFIFQAAAGIQAVFPFLSGFMGDPAYNASDEAAYNWVATYLQGKTLDPSANSLLSSGAVNFKTTDGYEEYIP